MSQGYHQKGTGGAGARKATAVAVFGTAIEYYDFSVYGYVASTLAIVFFPSDDPTVGLLSTLLVFGSAFLVRPLGAVFFGWIGDRYGRRISLIATISLIGVASVFTGLLPGYASIGIAAPISLVVLRMLQGFSTGGEIGGAASYIREWASPERRALYISFIPGVAQLGKGLAAGIAALVASSMSGPDMASWGWRIPFLLAGPLGAICLFYRLQIEDSPEFLAAKVTLTKDKTAAPITQVFTLHRAALAKVMLISLVQNVGTYIGTVLVAVYFSNVLGYSKSEASSIVLVAVLLAALLIPVAGLVGTRIGAKRLLLLSYLAYVSVTLPSFMLMNQQSVPLAMAGLALGMVPYALCQAGTYSIIPDFFPVELRHTGVAFGHSVGAVIGGGGGPYLATWLIDATGNVLVPAFLLIGAGMAGLMVVSSVRRPPGAVAHPSPRMSWS